MPNDYKVDHNAAKKMQLVELLIQRFNEAVAFDLQTQLIVDMTCKDGLMDALTVKTNNGKGDA